jgi:hypothetical protein
MRWIAVVLMIAFGTLCIVDEVFSQIECAHPTTRTWIRVSDAAGYFDTLWFGFHPTATACVDTQLCEFDIAPVPMPGVFFTYLRPPCDARVLYDYRGYVSRTQVDTHGVYFQSSWPPGQPMTLRWSTSAVAALCDSAIITDDFGGFFVRARMHEVDSVRVTMSVISQLSLYRYGAKTWDSLSLATLVGWNALALPITVPDRSVRAVFPTAISPAFPYVQPQGYVVRDTLNYGGVGYWVKFGTSSTVTLRGSFRSRDTARVVAGWNLVGNTISYPARIAIGAFSDTLQPGEATWVKFPAAGIWIIEPLGSATGNVRK